MSRWFNANVFKHFVVSSGFQSNGVIQRFHAALHAEIHTGITLVETLPIHRADGDTKLFWIDFRQNGDVIGNFAGLVHGSRLNSKQVQ